MQNKTMSLVKGLGIGMAVGASATCIGKFMMKDRHNITKGASKVARAVSDFADGVSTMFKG